MKKAFIKQLIEMAKKDKDIYLIVGDLGFNLVEPFKKEFPDRFINAGIAEQNMIGVAAGLALSGKKVFVYSIIPFLTMRAFEQIRNDLCYQELNVVLVGYGAGFTYGTAGSSHHALCDISIMRSLPNMTILSPYDNNETKMCITESINEKGPVYIRLGKAGEEIDNGAFYGISKFITPDEKCDVLILTTGQIADECLDAQIALNSMQINIAVGIIHKLKPIDKQFIKDVLSKYKYVIVVEEHSIIGGLGTIVSEIISEKKINIKLIKLGIDDKFVHEVGSQEYLRDKYGINGEGITDRIVVELKL